MKLENWKQLKIRSDLQVSTQEQEGDVVYIIKDPVTLRYFRLRPAEYAIFRMLDGRTPADDIRARLKRLGFDIGDEEFQAFLKQLGTANFFENVLPNQSESLYQMAVLRRSRRSIWKQVKRILYIKIPVCDPDRVFTRVMPWIGWMWSRWAIAVYAAVFAFAIWAFFAKYDEARRDFTGLLSPGNLLTMAAVILVIKIFHEFGHGLTCKRFGGEVHELGILVLCAFPCMYCNITDAWILDNRWRKIWISAAGIVTELVIASAAAIFWYFTEPPSVVNAIAYRIMIAAGISSVIINGNPLMKWDGYYILSDVLGMPNLRANSVRYLGQFARKYILGMSVPTAGPFDRARLTQLVYGLLSTFWIAYVMYRITRGMLDRFPALGVWVLISTLYGLIMVPLVRISQAVSKRRGRHPEVNLSRLSAVSAVLAVASYFMFLCDMSYNVSAPCVVEPAQKQVITAEMPGVLVEMPFKQGDTVREGQMIARLENPRLELALKEVLIEMDTYDLRMSQARSTGRLAGLDALVDARKKLGERADQLREEIASLTIKAPFAGAVTSQAPQFQIGRYLQRGAAVCEIADIGSAKVTIAVPEAAVRFVRKTADASVLLRAYPWQSFRGAVDSISDAPIIFLPNAALSSASGGQVVTRPDIAAAHVPIETLYRVDILLPNGDGRLLPGMVGKATISSGTRRLYDRVYVYCRESLRHSFGI